MQTKLKNAFLCTFVSSLLIHVGCSGDSESVNNSFKLSVEILSGSTLVLQPDDTYTQASSNRTYQFYTGGNVAYTYDSVSIEPETLTMQWQVENNTLYVNNGDRFSGAGSYSPQEWKFPEGLKPNAPAVAEFQTLEVKSFISGTSNIGGGLTGSTVGNNDLSDTKVAYSVDGDRTEKNVHIMIFYQNGTGKYLDNVNIEEYQIKEFTWDATANNGTLNIGYSDTQKGEILFLGSYAPGELFNSTITILNDQYTTQYTILKVEELANL